MSPGAQRLCAALIVASAFGPYLIGSVRSEQIVIYGVTTVVVARQVGRPLRIDPGIAVLIVLWSVILAASTLSAAFPPAGADNVAPWSGIDALLAPLCVMVVVGLWSGDRASLGDVLTTVQKWTVVVLALNTGLELAMSVVDLLPTLSAHWWSGADLSGSQRTIGEAAARYGRFGGVFNSPLAAGTAYSVGAVALAHLHLRREWTGPRAGVLMLAIVIGGLIPQSKAFLLAGLPVAALLLLLAAGKRVVPVAAGVIATAAATWLVLSRTQWWSDYGEVRLSRFFTDVQDPLDLYTAGRYVSGSNVSSIWDTVMENARWGGYGAGVDLGALDTSWTEMAARAGLIGFGAFVLWLAVVLVLWFSRREQMSRPQWWSVGAMWLVLIAASAGGPSITQNRAGTLLTLNLLLLLTAVADRRSPPEVAEPQLAAPRSRAAGRRAAG